MLGLVGAAMPAAPEMQQEDCGEDAADEAADDVDAGDPSYAVGSCKAGGGEGAGAADEAAGGSGEGAADEAACPADALVLAVLEDAVVGGDTEVLCKIAAAEAALAAGHFWPSAHDDGMMISDVITQMEDLQMLLIEVLEKAVATMRRRQ